MQVTIGDCDIAVDVAGQGEPILFVHAFPLDRRIWQSQVAAFAGTHRVIVPDLPGFGESGPPPAAAIIEDYADELAAVLDALEVREPVTLCGLSMGGYIAFAFFKRHRKRVRRLVLCDTKATEDPLEKKSDRELLAVEVLEQGTAKLAQNMPSNLLGKTTQRERPTIVETVRTMIADATPAGVAAASRAMALRPESTGLLAKIDVPALVVCGEEDVISTPQEMREMANQIPGAAYVEIAGAGHLSPLERSDDFNDALRRFMEVA
jgi:pimeloyl-ACP methyl ester carboxylesterase